MSMQGNDWSHKYMGLYNEYLSNCFQKGDNAKETSRERFKKPQLQEEKLQDPAFQLAEGETEGSILTLSPWR